MVKKKFIEDKERLLKLAPVAKTQTDRHVFVCCGTSCEKVGAREVMAEFAKELESRQIRFGKPEVGRNPKGSIMLTECGSVGFCSVGVAVIVYPDGIWYAQVTEDDVAEIVESHIIGGKPVERLVLKKV
ncbi:MAG: (2Fe-2S) ferredoxin domain-containing protein [Pyrinomonadaceae bacterium]